MDRIRIIHIDDEQETLQYSKTVFAQAPQLQYCGGFLNANAAIDYLANNDVDLIFCDVEMPEHNGLWLANNLPYNIPVVFITAHTGFAIEAFEACALHYLIKPLSAQHVANVIERFNSKALHSNDFSQQVNQFYNNYLPQSSINYPTRIYINNIGKIIIINLDELICLMGSGNYTKFYLQNEEIHTSSKNLKVYDDAIAYHPNFIRIHRSYIINKLFVKQIVKGNNQQWFVELTNHEKLEISKGKLDEILNQIQK